MPRVIFCGLLSCIGAERSRGAVIVVQHSAQFLASLDRSVALCQICLRRNQLVTESLMIAFHMVMGHELPDCPPQRALAEQDQSIQTRLLDRSHKPFGIGV